MTKQHYKVTLKIHVYNITDIRDRPHVYVFNNIL